MALNWNLMRMLSTSVELLMALAALIDGNGLPSRIDDFVNDWIRKVQPSST